MQVKRPVFALKFLTVDWLVILFASFVIKVAVTKLFALTHFLLSIVIRRFCPRRCAPLVLVAVVALHDLEP